MVLILKIIVLVVIMIPRIITQGVGTFSVMIGIMQTRNTGIVTVTISAHANATSISMIVCGRQCCE